MRLRDRIKKMGADLWDLLRFVVPDGRSEWGMLAFFFVFYASYSSVILFKTFLVDYPDPLYPDVYFSFDAGPFYHYGLQNPSVHPMLESLFAPIQFIGNQLQNLLGGKAKAVVIFASCNLSISFSVVYIFRYLRRVLDIKGYAAYLLAALFGFFGTNLILAFTPESFTMTSFFLTLTVCYFSISIKENRVVPYINNFILAILLGGITITNFVKGLIPTLFMPVKFKTIVLRVVSISAVFLLYLFYLEQRYKAYSIMQYHYSRFKGLPSEISQIEGAIDYFLGIPVLLSQIIQLPYHPRFGDVLHTWVNFDFYHHWWQYAFIGLLFGLALAGFFVNIKQKLVWMLALLFLVDASIHVLFRYGISEAYLYGAHWVFVLPLLLGWLYVKALAKMQKVLLCILSGMLVVLAVNNMYQIYRLISFAIETYPVSKFG